MTHVAISQNDDGTYRVLVDDKDMALHIPAGGLSVQFHEDQYKRPTVTMDVIADDLAVDLPEAMGKSRSDEQEGTLHCHGCGLPPSLANDPDVTWKVEDECLACAAVEIVRAKRPEKMRGRVWLSGWRRRGEEA